MDIKNVVAASFACYPNQLSSFTRQDPLNLDNTVSGFMCRKKGPYYGSMYITAINGKEENQIIYGTPTLQYPYKVGTTNYKDWSNSLRCVFATKWNGVNALFFKYVHAGESYFSVKTKGSPFIVNGEFGNFLDLLREWAPNNLGKWAHLLDNDPELQSIAFELCGTKEPHLVKYDFELDMKPIFYTNKSGQISPHLDSANGYLHFKSSDDLNRYIASSQQVSFLLNEEFRYENNLPAKYEYNHFATEGVVMYLVDGNGIALERTAYKIKPKDIEEVHWASFEKDYQARVNEAVKKIKMTEGEVTEENLKSELDMGPKEWDKFGANVLNYVKLTNKNNEIVVLVGLQGSGKSTIASLYKSRGYVIVNQDTLKSRKACKKLAEAALQAGQNVVIDRCNFDESQRKCWVDLAKQYGASKITAMFFDISTDTCIARAEKRKEHPNINKENARQVILDTKTKLVTPSPSEGFDEINIMVES